MHLALETCIVRSWQPGDVPSLVRYANNRHVWENLRDRFPHPYRLRDGQAFLQHVRNTWPETAFAIEVDGEAAGGIGFVLQQDVERVSAEIGYWLGEPFWGRGICTDAVRAVARYAVAQHGLTRVFALPFAHNAASCRVLEKAGFIVEGRLRRSAIKSGRIVDQVLYAWVPDEGGSTA